MNDKAYSVFELTLEELFSEVRREMNVASAHYGGFNSPHEALGVLVEEVNELTDEIRANCWNKARQEAIQIAAVALRFAAYPTILESDGVI